MQGRNVEENLEYVGFWPRVGAALIDTLLVLFLTVPVVTAIYGKEYCHSCYFGFQKKE